MALSEVRVFSRSYRYAGTLDAVGRWRDGSWVLIDWKTGDPRDVAAHLQTAGYAEALVEMLARGEEPYHVDFDPGPHTYWLDGHRIAGVTETLRWSDIINFSGANPEALAVAQRRGRTVHAAIHARYRGVFDAAAFAAAHPDCVPYLDAFDRFLAESHFTVATEIPKDTLTQAADLRRCAVELQETGRYHVHEYRVLEDVTHFLALAGGWNIAAPYRTSRLGALVQRAAVA